MVMANGKNSTKCLSENTAKEKKNEVEKKEQNQSYIWQIINQQNLLYAG